MSRSERTSKFAVSVKENSRSRYPSANGYGCDFHHGQILKKLPGGKTQSSKGNSSKNLNGTPSGASHLSKEVLGEGGQQRVVKTTAAVASPLVTATIVGAVALGFYGIANMLRYKRNEKSAAQAAKDTVTRSAGVGISTGLGVAAANAVAGTVGGTVFVPMAAGAAVAYASMAVWDKLFCEGKYLLKTT